LRGGGWDAKSWGVLGGWSVKAFYLPLMVSSVGIFIQQSTLIVGYGFMAFFSAVYTLLFAVDTAFATIGYCSTSRRVEAQIRSVEPTLGGWAVALVCYPPLNAVVLARWLSYKDGYDWNNWLQGHPIVLMAWGVTILLMVGLYVWATVAFGLRFSNLTNRGIITSGPYRYFKHPSYIGKNVAWWLISIPFISRVDFWHAFANSLSLLAINGIYIMRALTEQRHLMRDQVYVEYSEWIDKNGIAGKLRELFLARLRG